MNANRRQFENSYILIPMALHTASRQMSCSTAVDHQIYKGSLLGKYYKVESFLGEGGFGFVTKCRHVETDTAVAIKVNKNNADNVIQTRKEIAILKQLRCLDPDTCNIVKWNGFFFDGENICLNFECLDQDLHSYMKNMNFDCFPMTQLRPVIDQLATALSHLSSIGIVHADLKPQNVMVVDRKEQTLRVKLIDFGLAYPVAAAEPSLCVQTIWYRAPEVMLGIPYTEAIDMWSLGVTAIFLATGYPIYPGNRDYDMLSFILYTQGQPADHVLDRGLGTDYYFEWQNDGRQCWKFKTPKKFANETGYHPSDTREIRPMSLDELYFLMDDGDTRGRCQLVDLIKRMMHLDPDQRIKPLEVLQHPFFNDSIPQTSYADVCVQTDPKEETTEVSQPLSTSQTAGPENTDHRNGITPDSLPAGSEDDTGKVDAQPETNAKNNNWSLWRFLKWIGSYIPLSR